MSAPGSRGTLEPAAALTEDADDRRMGETSSSSHARTTRHPVLESRLLNAAKLGLVPQLRAALEAAGEDTASRDTDGELRAELQLGNLCSFHRDKSRAQACRASGLCVRWQQHRCIIQQCCMAAVSVPVFGPRARRELQGDPILKPNLAWRRCHRPCIPQTQIITCWNGLQAVWVPTCGQTLNQSASVEVLPYGCGRVALGAGLRMQGDRQLATHHRQSLNIFAATNQAWGAICIFAARRIGQTSRQPAIAGSVAEHAVQHPAEPFPAAAHAGTFLPGFWQIPTPKQDSTLLREPCLPAL